MKDPKPNRLRSRNFAKMARAAEVAARIIGEVKETASTYAAITGLPDNHKAMESAVNSKINKISKEIGKIQSAWWGVRRNPVQQMPRFKFVARKGAKPEYTNSIRTAVKKFCLAVEKKSGMTYALWVRNRRKAGLRKKSDISINAFLLASAYAGGPTIFYIPASGGGYVWSANLNIFPALQKITTAEINSWA